MPAALTTPAYTLCLRAFFRRQPPCRLHDRRGGRGRPGQHRRGALRRVSAARHTRSSGWPRSLGARRLLMLGHCCTTAPRRTFKLRRAPRERPRELRSALAPAACPCTQHACHVVGVATWRAVRVPAATAAAAAPQQQGADRRAGVRASPRPAHGARVAARALEPRPRFCVNVRVRACGPRASKDPAMRGCPGVLAQCWRPRCAAHAHTRRPSGVHVNDIAIDRDHLIMIEQACLSDVMHPDS
jgi:hypothetical protein